MNADRTTRAGYSLLEVLIAGTLLVLVVAGSVSGLFYVMFGERMNSIQMELDIDVRSAMEWIKSDLRLSSMDHIFFYPDGVGPYEGVSFPMAEDLDTNGLIDLDTNTYKIIWTKTMIYHVWNEKPMELRVTTYNNRYNDATPVERQSQLSLTVTNGNGDASCLTGETSVMMPIFENLFHWSLAPQGGVFDAYSATPGLVRALTLGSAVLAPGDHEFTFTVYGQNAGSTGYKLGLDDLTVSPCGAEREAEAQLPATAESVAACEYRYMAGGSWGGNYDLFFPGTAVGDFFTLTMENDRWEETNFRGLGSFRDDTKVEFDQSLSPTNFIVRLAGGNADTNWYAWNQTGNLETLQSTGPNEIRGCAVRVLIRGGDMDSGRCMDHSGGNVKLRFDAGRTAGVTAKLRIEAAYIAECAQTELPTPDAKAGTSKQLLFDGTDTCVELSEWGERWAWPASGDSFTIDKDKSYLVSFLVSTEANKGCAEYWPEVQTNVPGSYVIPWTNSPDASALQDPIWSSMPYYVTNRLYAVKIMVTTYATNGTFTSQILDTHLDDPAYSELNWRAYKPAGTYLGLRARAGDQEDLSDANAWSNLNFVIAPGSISLPAGRYVQWQALLKPANNAVFDGCTTPKLMDVTVRWGGETRLTDIGASLTTGPDHGVYRLTVDGVPLIRGVLIDLEIYEDVTGPGGKPKRLTSAMRAVEIEPRNTGK